MSISKNNQISRIAQAVRGVHSDDESDRDETRVSSIRSQKRELREWHEGSMVGPTRQMEELDGMIGPTRPFGELDIVVGPTRPFDELDGVIGPTCQMGELNNVVSPTPPFGELDGAFFSKTGITSATGC
ncbi:hypothetical protein F2Q70_00029583 [Brassica cretica]|uniref:Uncharacterized protein n=1 Tax=Brassica cretica TaxID=69181 RepID=A0A8S9FKH4_BRACR|nr:hypothetical protein F2Q70_00029583 [Brassica cretica]KAF2552178.1 hypothetical protein F2Q68_00033996 [Brassica cretica]